MAKVIAKVELHSDAPHGRTYLLETLVPNAESGFESSGTFSVTRTRSNFELLYHAYEESHPWAILPEVPAEIGVSVRRFMTRLESFLRLLLLHPDIGRDKLLFDFLTNNNWSPPAVQSNSRNLSSLLASSSKAKIPDPKFVDERRRIDTTLLAIRNASESLGNIAQYHEDIAFSIVEAGTILHHLGIADTVFWGELMKAQSDNVIALGESQQSETTELHTLVRQPMESVVAILNRGRVVLDHRDKQHERHQTIEAELERLKQELGTIAASAGAGSVKPTPSRWFGGTKPEEKEAKLKIQLKETQDAAGKERQEYDEVAKKLTAEIKFIEHATAEDFSKLLLEAAVRQRAFCEEQLSRWEDMASVLAQGGPLYI